MKKFTRHHGKAHFNQVLNRFKMSSNVVPIPRKFFQNIQHTRFHFYMPKFHTKNKIEYDRTQMEIEINLKGVSSSISFFILSAKVNT